MIDISPDAATMHCGNGYRTDSEAKAPNAKRLARGGAASSFASALLTVDMNVIRSALIAVFVSLVCLFICFSRLEALEAVLHTHEKELAALRAHSATSAEASAQASESARVLAIRIQQLEKSLSTIKAAQEQASGAATDKTTDLAEEAKRAADGAQVAVREVVRRIVLFEDVVGAVKQMRAAMGMPAIGQSQAAFDEAQLAALARKQQDDANAHQSDEQRRQHQMVMQALEQQQPPPVMGQGYRSGDPPPPQQQQQQPAVDTRYQAYNQQAAGAYNLHYQQAIQVPDPVADVVDPLKRSVKQAAIIKKEFADCWAAYKRYAWGHDELKPVSKKVHDWGGKRSKGVALTAVDSLSTLYLMGFKDEFQEAVRLVTEEVDYTQSIHVSAFEYTIRSVGGMLSAYELSGESDPRLLATARLVMDRLLVAYNTTTGIPHQTVNLQNHKHWTNDWTSGASVLSEIGSVQLELRTLSYHTSDPVYDIKATHITDVLEAACAKDQYLCPTFIDSRTGQGRNDQLTLGALGDSYYEYLLKQYILTGHTEPRYERMTLAALDAAIDRLLQYSQPSRQPFFADFTEGVMDLKMDHLACFAGGLYALAAETFPHHNHVKTFRKVAESITLTCYSFYQNQLSGLSPESVQFTGGGDYVNGEAYYLLRPETVESLFYMWRFTKDQKFRDMAWQIFVHLRAYCKVQETGAYSGVQQVTIVPPEHDDTMQSFFLAETLKYLYLIFSEDEVLMLDEWVFNTEAHPLRIRKRNPMAVWEAWEKAHNGVPAFMPPSVSGVMQPTGTAAMQQRRLEGPVVAPVDVNSFDDAPPGEVEYNENGEPV